MNRNNQIKKLIFFGGPLLIILLVAVFFQARTSAEVVNSNNMITADLKVSLDSGFYKENQNISVEVPKTAIVYYTDTCEEPTSENGKEYTGPISIEATEEETVYVYRFKAYYEDGRESEVVNRTYFMGTGIDSRYTTNVLHVAGAPEGLFGYEEGIFVPGRVMDEYFEKNPEADYGVNLQANFTQRGEEYEREVYIEYFSPEGTSLMSQDCGIRIFGNVSRIKNQKSFRLYARKEYDEQNEFRGPVLPQLLSEAGIIAQEHKRLIVRSGGTDNGFAYLRSELTGTLAAEAGFPDVMYAEPVCVYINGMYFGIYWLENDFDRQYFVNRYGEYNGEFICLEGADSRKDSDEDPNIQKYVEEYNDLYTRFSAMDLTDDKNFRELQKVLDIENYLQYFALEYYMGNNDWPQGNVKVYRYVSPDNEYEEGTVFDGRYRHLLFDTDFAFGLLLSPEQALISDLMSGDAPLFEALLERQDCRDYFASYVCDLFNGAFSYANVAERLEEMYSSREDELRYMLEETDIMKDSLWMMEPNPTPDYENVEKSYQTILDYADVRSEEIYTDLTLMFQYDFAKWYNLNVSKFGKSDLKVNTILVEEDVFSGHYIGDIPVVLTPVMDRNEEFDYWLVNGEVREEEKLSLTPEDILEGQIYVEMVVHATDDPILQINAIRAKGQNDYIEVINLSNQDISTKGYYLSDSDNAYRYDLPTTVIAPGETMKYYGQDCMDTAALGHYGMNFNITEGETVTLTCGTETLESVYIPDLLENGIYQRNGNSGKFVEVLIEE